MILSLIIKMLVCSFILLGYYWLFLRNKRFHHYNRFYLLGITGISIIIPFIRIPIFVEPDTPTAQLVSRSIEIISVNRWEHEIIEPQTTGFSPLFNLQNALFLLYALVILILLYSLGRSLKYIRNLSRRYSFEKIKTLKLYNTTEPGTPFSFFRSIFWNSRLDFNSKEGQQIFRHELFHVKQQHSADILFLEVTCIIFWINPFFHLIKKEIKAIHEFLADQHAVSHNNQADYAELLILQSLSVKRSSISNYFFQNHIKRRIAMITQFKSKKYSYWTRLLVLPLSVLLFCAIALHARSPRKTFTNDQPYKNAVIRTPAPLTVLIDAGHGGEDAGVKSRNGLMEKDLSLAIARQIQEQAKTHNLKIVMTRDKDVMPTLRERSGMVETVKADLMISIHVAASETENAKSGFEIYITNKNHSTLEKSKILGSDVAEQLKTLYEVAPIKQRKEKGIWILDAVQCPAVLIECGYLTSEKDLAFITNPENQVKIANTILKGIADYQSRDMVINQTDTVPDNITISDTSDVKLMEAQKKKQLEQVKRAEAKLIELEAKQKALEQKQRELEISLRKQGEARLQEKVSDQKALQQKQAELDKNYSKLAEKKAVEQQQKQEAMQRKQQEIEIRQKKMAEQNLAEMEHRQKAIEQKQQKMEIEHKKMAEEKLALLELQQKAISQKNHDLEIQRKKMTEERIADIELREKVMKQKHQDMELTQQKIAEARYADLLNEQKAIQQKQKELEILQRKIEESRLQELELEEKAKLQTELDQQKNETAEKTNKATETSGPLFTKVEIKPEYPGGKEGWQAYLSKTLRYPQEAVDKEISGTVVVQFVVDKNGKVTDVTALKGPVELLNEAVRLIRESGTWVPARQNGRVVRAVHQQPITFKITAG